MSLSRIENEITQQSLPAGFIDNVIRNYVPIADDLAQRAIGNEATLLVGVQGCQGSGKSTLASFLKILLDQRHCRASVLSIDDFYLTKSERAELAANVHPLLATRGVPGTHDINLALEVIDKLTSLTDGERYAVPRFDKSIDDRADPTTWDVVSGKQSIIILEGWCVGIQAQAPAELEDPRNSLEQKEDSDGIWRKYVNERLAGHYQSLFQRLATLIVLTAPSFECVFRWRSLQEQKLIQKLAKQKAEGAEADKKSGASIQTMNPEQILRFISHYQRLTEHALQSLPPKADWLIELAEDHQIVSCRKKM